MFCLNAIRYLTIGCYGRQHAPPPGTCHSCNIREMPEWGRGPDDVRTSCNTCGLGM
ncbi:hypothetical protein BD769DRAFT_1365742 [Suillus cothurnatus]|nr:hypothetical protein BD769DRAFT_1365742 [Suillus cothurnatus]